MKLENLYLHAEVRGDSCLIGENVREKKNRFHKNAFVLVGKWFTSIRSSLNHVAVQSA